MTPAKAKTPPVVWHGNEELRAWLVPIADVTPHPDNPRRGHLPTIAQSLKAHGQQKPIVVQASTGYILAGNHTKLAAEEVLAWTHIARVTVDVSDDAAAAYMLADNRSSDVGEYNLEKLLASLKRFEETGTLLGTGYTADDVDSLVAEMNAAVLPETEFKGGYAETEEEIQSRRDTRAASLIVRDIVLSFPEEDYQRLAEWIKMLLREWELTSVREVVQRAVKEAAERL